MEKRILILLTFLLAVSTVYHNQAAAADGFYISNRQLLDANGNNFVIRGINNPHIWFDWDGQMDAYKALTPIAELGANAVRIVWQHNYANTSTEKLRTIIERCLELQMIPVIELHDATGSDNVSDLNACVNYWIQPDVRNLLIEYQRYIIINIANEWMGAWNRHDDWAAGYISAVETMRNAGLKHTLMIDAAGWGQEWQSVNNKGVEDFNSDPEKNIIFSVHMYGQYGSAVKVNDTISTLSAKLPLVIGEFRHNHSDGDVDEVAILTTCHNYGTGLMAWPWKGISSEVAYLDLSNSWTTTTDLTDWGMTAFHHTYGIANTAQKASVFTGAPTPTLTSPEPTPKPTSTTEPTPTPTEGPTPTPTPTSTFEPGQVRVEARCEESNPDVQSLIRMNIWNEDNAALNNLSARYFMDLSEVYAAGYSAGNVTLDVYYSSTGVTVSPLTAYDTANRIYYYELDWGSYSVAPGARLEANFSIHLTGWQPAWDPANDWSYQELAGSYTNTPYIPVYRSGELIYGLEPGGSPPPTPTATTEPEPTPTPTSEPEPTPTPTTEPEPTPTPTPTSEPEGDYVVNYDIVNDWGGGATIDVTITNNTSSTVNGWTLEWTFPGNQQISNLWGGSYTQTGASVSVTNLDWNADIVANGGSVNFGFNINYSGINDKPTAFTLNGHPWQIL